MYNDLGKYVSLYKKFGEIALTGIAEEANSILNVLHKH